MQNLDIAKDENPKQISWHKAADAATSAGLMFTGVSTSVAGAFEILHIFAANWNHIMDIVGAVGALKAGTHIAKVNRINLSAKLNGEAQ
jgi:hypothetical protein